MIKCVFGNRYFFFNMGIAWCSTVSKWSIFGNHPLCKFCAVLLLLTQHSRLVQSSYFDIPKLQLDTRQDYLFKKSAVKHNFLLRELCLIFGVNRISSVYVSSWRLSCDVTFKLSALFRFTISGQWLITKGIIQGLAHFLLTLLVGPGMEKCTYLCLGILCLPFLPC